MAYRIRSTLGCLLWLVTAAMAGESPPPAITAENAPAARARAKEMRESAQKRFEADKADCNTRMLAIGCMTVAQERRAP